MKLTGEEAKQTITALTELQIIPNKTLDTTRPTRAPALLRRNEQRESGTKGPEKTIDITHTKDVVTGSLREVKESDSKLSIKCAKQPVTPPMTKHVISSTFGTRSSLTIVDQPLFSKSSVACKPASVKLYP